MNKEIEMRIDELAQRIVAGILKSDKLFPYHNLNLKEDIVTIIKNYFKDTKNRNENFETEKEEEFKIDENIVVSKSDRKIRVIKIINGVTVTVFTAVVEEGKLGVYDFWGWGD